MQTKAEIITKKLCYNKVMKLKKHKYPSDYIHSAFFGVEDSLVSNTGALAGIAIGSGEKSVVLLTAVVMIAVGAISLGASEFISEETAEEIRNLKKPPSPLVSALILSTMHVFTGLSVLLPYLILPPKNAIMYSVVIAILGLMLLGATKSKLTNKNRFKSILEVTVVGGIATIIGIIVGLLFRV